MSAAHHLSHSIAMFEDTTAKPTEQLPLPAEIVCDEAGLSTVGASSASAVFGELWDRVRRKLRADCRLSRTSSSYRGTRSGRIRGGLELQSGAMNGAIVADPGIPTGATHHVAPSRYAPRMRSRVCRGVPKALALCVAASAVPRRLRSVGDV